MICPLKGDLVSNLDPKKKENQKIDRFIFLEMASPENDPENHYFA